MKLGQIKIMHFGIFIYDGTEPIDLATFGVLSMARRIRPDISISTVAPKFDIVRLSNGLRIVADYDVSSAPYFDVLIVTGGPGWIDQSKSRKTLDFIRSRANKALLVSVCTGSMILAASGVLDGKAATTKREVVSAETPLIQTMRAEYPQIDVRDASVVNAGHIITGGGVSLCIDTMLHVLQKLFGSGMAAKTARSIEYHRAWSANRKQFPPVTIGEVKRYQVHSR
jgi:transcriptional regulator GlxA family with amidase domain